MLGGCGFFYNNHDFTSTKELAMLPVPGMFFLLLSGSCVQLEISYLRVSLQHLESLYPQKNVVFTPNQGNFFATNWDHCRKTQQIKM